MAKLTVTWVLPTTRFPSGRPLPVEEIAGVEIELSADGGVNYGSLGVFPPNVLTVDIPELEAGTWFVRGTVTDTKGKPSKPLVASAEIADESGPGVLLALDLSVTI